MKPELAVIGYGRFGRFAAHHLKKYFRVYVADTRKGIRIERGIVRVTLEEAAAHNVILLATPINKLQPVLRKISPLVKKGALICDVCSVKEKPIRWMKEILPSYVSILGAHPLFGPDSASKSVRGNHLILCPVRISSRELKPIERYAKKAGLHVHTMSASGHDALMASTLFLTQFIGHGLHRLPMLQTDIATNNFRLLRHVAATTANDTLELFQDMYRSEER